MKTHFPISRILLSRQPDIFNPDGYINPISLGINFHIRCPMRKFINIKLRQRSQSQFTLLWN